MPGVPDIKLIRTDTFSFVPPKGWAAEVTLVFRVVKIFNMDLIHIIHIYKKKCPAHTA